MRLLLSIIALFATLVDAFSEWLGRLVSWLTLGMVVVTFLVVVLRYGFDLGWIAMQESVVYMHSVVFLLGAAYTLKHDAHVRVDILYQRFGPKPRSLIDFLGAWLLLMPVCGFIAWSAWDYVNDSWAVHETSREAGGLEAVYLLKSLILIFAVTMMLQGFSQSLRALLVMAGYREARTE
ncbi:MAG: C4-dicarboxylate ABC transporter permease [Methylothermaceae bacteria B42]|nr:MAG: C4-dicarboxylate ABC transporter permease [Methylothermaceae bacteria B42]HHJ38820.1 TRAP transporter small permease subunit [Methylothermaceae bacterium]